MAIHTITPQIGEYVNELPNLLTIDTGPYFISQVLLLL